MSYRYILFLVVVIFSLTQCSKDKLEFVEGECIGETTYDNQIQPIIANSCAYSNCHDGSGLAPGNFNSYAGMLSILNESKFDTRAVINRDMPPSYATGPKSLTQEEIALLQCWIENEYKEN